MRPVRGRDGAVAIAVAASRPMDRPLLIAGRFVAGVGGLPQATRMRRRGQRLHRRRKKSSGEREPEKESCDHPLHVFW